MRVLSIGNFTNGWDGSICDEEHIASALEELGHEVTRWQRGEIGTFNYPYDIALIAQWDGYGPKLFEMLHNMTKTIVYWAFDYQAEGQEWHERLVAESDLYLSKRIADSKYPNWQWFSQDFAPAFLDKFHPGYENDGTPSPVFKDIDVLFTGSYLPWATERNETLKAVDEKFNLVIHSVNEWPGFKDVRPPLMDLDLPELYARAKIVLSIDHTIEAGYWSDRNAQIMACGGFVLCRYVSPMESIFRRNISYFHNLEECLEMIDEWLVHEDRELFADQGYRYAQENLKVINKAQELLAAVSELLPKEIVA